MCRVFVPSVGRPFVDVVWIANNYLVLSTQPSDRIYTAEQRSEPSTEPSFFTAFVFTYCLEKTYFAVTLFN